MKPPIFHRNFHYDRRLLPNAYLASLETDIHTIEEASERTGATIGYPGWGVLYYLLLSHLDPQRDECIVETGTNWGCTTIILAQALIDAGVGGSVITIELEADNVRRARANLAAAGVADRVDVIEGDSRINLPTILPERCHPGSVRFAFLDASHRENDLLKEFESVRPYLADDAIVAMDNTYRIAEPHEDQRVNGALRRFPERYGGNLINMEFVSWYTPGLCLWQLAPNLDGTAAREENNGSGDGGGRLAKFIQSLRFARHPGGR
jgi:predicted O-methyltransferase YrrM